MQQILSKKEIRVIELMCQELVIKQIAAIMGISTRTVDKYKCEIRFKLDIKTDAGIAIYAIKNGIHKL